MKILITGGAGFIGNVLARLLVEQGHRVVIYDKVGLDSEHSFKADVRDLPTLKVAAEGVDVIYNLAAEHRDDVRPISLYDEVNIGGARNVVAAAAYAGAKTVIFTSSVAVYGDSDKPLDENAPHNWINDYGRTKSLAEVEHLKWAEADPSRKLVVIRPSVVFGPRNRGNVYNLLKQVAGGRFLMIGNGQNRKSMAFVDNVAAFLAFTLSFPEGISVYNYADKPDFNMNDLVSLIRKRMGRGQGVGPRLPVWAAYFAGATADAVATASGKSLPISRVRVQKFIANTEVNALRAHASGFQPQVTLEAGLSATLDAEFSDAV